MPESLIDHIGTNGDLPADHIDEAVTTLLTASSELREYRDNLKLALDTANDRLGRYDKAISALTKPKPEPKDRAKTEQRKVKLGKQRKGAGDPSVTQAAEGYPSVSDERQQKVLSVLRSFDHPVRMNELRSHPDFDLADSTASNALAHLRARGLIRLGAKAGNANTYAAYPEHGDTEGDE